MPGPGTQTCDGTPVGATRGGETQGTTGVRACATPAPAESGAATTRTARWGSAEARWVTRRATWTR